ncbi:hypothetical protein ACIQXV_07785 [Neobacillus sp. NPDC097160]|uniref:hypothetical protein n=1 Tax=Neobacillus sp. NPDC097160 TaxID=3364298 RepID=UPI0037F9585D
MKIGGIAGITIILVLIFFSEWPRVKKNKGKMKWTFISLMVVNWVLAVLLVMFPEMPGPGQLIDFIYKSFEPFW